MVFRFHTQVLAFLKREDGPTAVEYAVMLGAIITACLVGINALGTNACSKYSTVASTLGT